MDSLPVQGVPHFLHSDSWTCDTSDARDPKRWMPAAECKHEDNTLPNFFVYRQTKSHTHNPQLTIKAFSDSMPTYDEDDDDEVRNTSLCLLWKCISLKLYSASNHQGGSRCSDYKKILHLFNPAAIYNRVKSAEDICLGDLHVQTPEPKTERQILMTCFLECLFNPPREGMRRGGRGSENCWVLCASLWEVDTETGHSAAQILWMLFTNPTLLQNFDQMTLDSQAWEAPSPPDCIVNVW